MKRKIRDNLKDLYWSLKGTGIQNPELPVKVKSIMFVCLGNICRSPFAEKIALKICEKRNISETKFDSSGITMRDPVPSPDTAIDAATSFGVDLSSHLSKTISEEIVESSDMVITMEAWQWEELRKSFPGRKEKIFLLPLFDTEAGEGEKGYPLYHIPDPYGKSIEEYRSCFSRIERCVSSLIETVTY